MRILLKMLLTVIQSGNLQQQRDVYVHKKALRVVLNDYISSYRDLLDKVSKPTLYVARIKAIAVDAYKCYVNENPPYINTMFDSVDKPYNLKGPPLEGQP